MLELTKFNPHGGAFMGRLTFRGQMKVSCVVTER